MKKALILTNKVNSEKPRLMLRYALSITEYPFKSSYLNNEKLIKCLSTFPDWKYSMTTILNIKAAIKQKVTCTVQ